MGTSRLSVFDRAVWSHVWGDFKPGLRRVWRMIPEIVVAFPVSYILLSRFGSDEAAYDFAIEKLLAPLGLAVLVVIHLLWSWATAPRKMFYRQRKARSRGQNKIKLARRQRDEARRQIQQVRNAETQSEKGEVPNTVALFMRERDGLPDSSQGADAWLAWLAAFGPTISMSFGQTVLNAFEREVRTSIQGQWRRRTQYFLRYFASALMEGREVSPEDVCRPRLLIEFEKSSHVINTGHGCKTSFSVRAVSSARIDDIHVKIASMRATNNKTAAGQNAAQFTGHHLAVMRNPPLTQQGFSIEPDDSEVINLCWTDKAADSLRFSGYDETGQLRTVGFATTNESIYEVTVIATSNNAATATETFRLSAVKNNQLRMSICD